MNSRKYRMLRRLIAPLFALALISPAHALNMNAIADAVQQARQLAQEFKAGAQRPQQGGAPQRGASAASCERHFYRGAQPTLAGAIATRATLLCFEDFAVLHSGVTKTPLYAAEYLTREAIRRGKAMARTDNFHAETRITPQFRAELGDYRSSGFDRGHMVPDKDAPWSDDLDSLANMVPQAPELNRGGWADLEKDVRRLATLRGAVHVITGPIFEGREQHIGRGVRVPSHVFKVVLDPARGDVQAFIARNTNDGRVEVIDLPTLERRAGLRFFQ